MAQRTDLMLPNTDYTCTVCRWPFERARSEQTTQSEPLLWTLRPRPPLSPHPHWAKGRNDHLFMLWEHSRHARRHHYAAEMNRSLDGRSPFPNRKYSPSESESANNICNTVQLFIVIWRFSLTIYSHCELNCSRINDTIAHLLCYFLEHFWSRIEVLHVLSI